MQVKKKVQSYSSWMLLLKVFNRQIGIVACKWLETTAKEYAAHC